MQWWNWAGMDKELNPVSDLCQFSAAITTHRIRLLLHFSASKMVLLYNGATKTLQSISVISTIFKMETSKGGKPQFIYIAKLSRWDYTWSYKTNKSRKEWNFLEPHKIFRVFGFCSFFCGKEKERGCKSSGSQHLLPDLRCPQRKLMHTGDTSWCTPRRM